MRGTVRERLYARLIPCADPACDCNGCLLWSGATTGKGYGHIGVGSRKDGSRRVALVHVEAWKLENGPVPEGLELDHVKTRGCRHKLCANVAHLEPVTHRENVLRGDTLAAAQVARTECPRGHPYDASNTRVADGKRRCRTCAREGNARRRRQQHEAAALPGRTEGSGTIRIPRAEVERFRAECKRPAQGRTA